MNLRDFFPKISNLTPLQLRTKGYYPMFRHLKSQLKELHVVLACGEDKQKVFPGVPIIGLKNNKI